MHMKSMCKSCNYIHKSDEGCWKGASGKSHTEMKKAELEKASTWPDESEVNHYNYYLVHKQAGTLLGGFEYKQDAVDASKDIHIPASEVKVTHRSKIDPAVKEKYHRDNKVMSKLKKAELEKAKIIDAKTREVKADLPSDEPTPKKGKLSVVGSSSQTADKATYEDHMAEILRIGHDPVAAARVKAEKKKKFEELEASQVEKSELKKAKVDEGKSPEQKGAARARRNQRSVKPGTERGPAGGKLRSFMSRVDRAADLRSGVPGKKGEKITGEPRGEKGVHVRSGDYARHAAFGGKGADHAARIVDRNSPKGERDHWRTPHPNGSKAAHDQVMTEQKNISPRLDKSDLIKRVKDKLKK